MHVLNQAIHKNIWTGLFLQAQKTQQVAAKSQTNNQVAEAHPMIKVLSTTPVAQTYQSFVSNVVSRQTPTVSNTNNVVADINSSAAISKKSGLRGFLVGR